MYYDNRRQIVEPKDLRDYDMSKQVFDSVPLHNIKICARNRFLFKLPYLLPYNQTSARRRNQSYRCYLEVGVRNFLKGYLSKAPCFGLQGCEFALVKEIINFIHGFEPAKSIRISPASISNLKHRKIILRPVPNTPENIAFTQYVKQKFPYFDDKSFLKKLH